MTNDFIQMDRDRWIGAHWEDLDTPALLLDRRASDRNIETMADFFRHGITRLRPHFKNHKCVTLAKRQLNAGSCVGMTCAKLGEAEVLAAAGIDDVLIANQVVGRAKLERLVEVARQIDLKVAVDHLEQAAAISQAAAAAGVTVGILVEVDIGMGRCGTAPGQETLDLVRELLPLPGLRFDGIQAFEGHVVYVNDPEERSTLVRDSFKPAIETRTMLEKNGITVRILSGGSSATHAVTGAIDGVNELQAGSYATMDWRYAEMIPEFEVALSIVTRVISRRSDTAVLDVGLKGAGCEFGTPRIRDFPSAKIPSFVSEEHCVVHEVPDWKLGQAIQLLPSHACTTCNLYREMFVHEEGRIVDVWPIEASGKLT